MKGYIHEENSNSHNINININNNNEKNNMELEIKKQESNVLEYVNIDNNEVKSEENYKKDNNATNRNDINNWECPMEIEENIKEENKKKKEKYIQFPMYTMMLLS